MKSNCGKTASRGRNFTLQAGSGRAASRENGNHVGKVLRELFLTGRPHGKAKETPILKQNEEKSLVANTRNPIFCVSELLVGRKDWLGRGMGR